MKRLLTESRGAASIEYAFLAGTFTFVLLAFAPVLHDEMDLAFRHIRFLTGGQSSSTIPGGTNNCWDRPDECPDDPGNQRPDDLE